jgi:glycosyltransferase involved in cell wall biosynthesis
VRILHCLYYYRPHYSGLTVYTERLALGLAGRGHHVTVLTSRYDRSLPRLEHIDGIEVRRVPVALKISKGPIMPAFLPTGWGLARSHDIVHLHVPQLDAAPLALMARLLGRPTVLTYHCDLSLPQTPLNSLANALSHLADRMTASLSNVIVTNTRDYAEQSPLLSRHLDRLRVIAPPISVAACRPEAVEAMRRRLGITPGQKVIGMAARLASEKGADTLAAAMPAVLQRYPDARVLYVGQYQNVMGEEAYARRLAPSIEALGLHWTFLGVLPAEEMGAFYRLCDVTVLPSHNSTESFGMVQVESMSCGTPVVASDLPGVRQPVGMTGMGLVVPPRDAAALAGAMIEVLQAPAAFRKDAAEIARRFSTASVAEQYELLYVGLLRDWGAHRR